MGDDSQPKLFETRRELPAHCRRGCGERSAEDADTTDPSGGRATGPDHHHAPSPPARRHSGPARRSPHQNRRRLQKYSGSWGRRRLSVQYRVMRAFAVQGFITTGQILDHRDSHVRASAKQRIRDCRQFGLQIMFDEFGDRGIWRMSTVSRRRARRLVATADKRAARRFTR